MLCVFYRLARYARAVRFWLLLALIAFSYFGINEAKAQSSGCSISGSVWVCSSQFEAEYKQIELTNQWCNDWVAGKSITCLGYDHNAIVSRPNDPYAGYVVGYAKYKNKTGSDPPYVLMSGYGYVFFMPCPAGTIKNSKSGKCMTPCETRGDISPSGLEAMPNGSIGCSDGCLYMYSHNADGSGHGTFFGNDDIYHCDLFPNPDDCADFGPGYFMNYGSGMCQPPVDQCPEGQMKGPDGDCKLVCPAGMTPDSKGVCMPSNNTCPAGETKGPDGSCVKNSCPSGQVAGADGTCKKSSDTDKDEGDEDKYFSGGDNCSAPPACSGDPILCGQARIQWRIDCNTRRNVNIAGGACGGAMPVCTGEKCDAMEYAQLLLQWRTACALEKSGPSTGGDGDGMPDWLTATGLNQDGGVGSTGADSPKVDVREVSTSDIDSSGWLGGFGTCPAIVASPGGGGIAANFLNALAAPPAYFCNFIGMMSALVLLGGALSSAYILAKG